jgi:hypothetical protein
MADLRVLPGKWLIRYPPRQLDFPAVLATTLEGSQWIQARGWKPSRIQVVIDPRFNESCYCLQGKTLYIELKDRHPRLLREKVKPKNGDIGAMPQRPIEKVLLAYPFRLNDRRWDTISITASSLFLGSALSGQGFSVEVKKQLLPAADLDPAYMNHDLVGLTLFEDLFLETREFLGQLRANYPGLLAAGGPLVTLNPLESAFHLPELHLLVRGEAEFILPGLLKAIAGGDVDGFFHYKGVLFQADGLVLISDIDEINCPLHFENFHFQLDFLQKEHLGQGLEMNVSRGCKRGCLFCSRVQGKSLRQLAPHQFAALLQQYEQKIAEFNVDAPHTRSVNINDDDMLQDIDYAAQIFGLIKKHGFRLWGVQTAVSSLFTSGNRPNLKVIECLDDPQLFVNNRPLLWLGTDTFIKERGRRLGKRSFSPDELRRLCQELERKNITHYHYWISSDQRTDWREFVEEFLFICDLHRQFKTFGLLAHAPFVIPYAATPLYRQLKQSAAEFQRLKIRKMLTGPLPLFDLPLVERLETPHEHLNRLLKNEKNNRQRGFFDCLKERDYAEALMILYYFLKQERFRFESGQKQDEAAKHKTVEARIEEYISDLTTHSFSIKI